MMRTSLFKRTGILLIAALTLLLLVLPACSKNAAGDEESAPVSGKSGQIYLYGEQHGVEKILDQEFNLWHEWYHNENMRHLFVELPYYTAEFLNIWMQSDNDEILNTLYDDWEGSAAHNPYIKEFYQKIKQECPQTVFHGTDVGHQYATTGERFLSHLQNRGQKDSEQYQTAQKVIEQGKYYYEHSDSVYRENMMVENFTFEFDKLNSENVAGFYGSAHTSLEAMDITNTIPCMANQLKEIYGDAVHSEDLTWLAKISEPYRMDTLEIGGKQYEVSYFGKEDLTGFKDFASREFWRIENAYDDFKDLPKTGDVLPYDNYPMLIETGQIFMIDYTQTDGSVMRTYYRSDGEIWEGQPATEGFIVK